MTPSGPRSATGSSMAEIRLSAPVQFDSIVDGEGLRAVIWTQGCPHRCPGCHNPQTHDPYQGFLMSASAIEEQLRAHPYLDGVTFSGGEPMLQPEVCRQIAVSARQLGFNIWCYTGYTWEQLTTEKDASRLSFLEQIDFLIDGRFEIGLRSLALRFRGSSNQRIIDVPKSLKSGGIVLKP